MNGACTRRTLLGSAASCGVLGLVSTGRTAASEPPQSAEPFGVAWEDIGESGRGGSGLDLARTTGGYVLAGTIHTERNNSGDEGLLRKIDRNGVPAWERRFQREGGWEISAVETVGSGYAAVANRVDDGGGGTSILCLDFTGTVVWEEPVGTSANDRLHDLTVVEGELLVVGRKEREEHQYDGWVLKYDVRGDRQLERTYHRDAAEAEFECVEYTDDDGCVVLGRIQREDGQATQILQTRIATDGTQEAIRVFSIGEDHDYPGGLVCTSDGGFLATGSTRRPEHEWTAWARKFGADGGQAWGWENEDGRLNRANDAAELVDGSYLLVGIDGRARNPWTASLGADGTLRWTHTEQTPEADVYTAVVNGHDGALVAGSTWSDGTTGWPNPWMARLSSAPEPANDGFDPRVHGFGFSNWEGETGYGADGSQFTLPYERVTRDDARNWIMGLDDPIDRGYDLWEGSVDLIDSLGNRQFASDGHCLGMAHAADYYYRLPGQLPGHAAAANDMPRPTGEYQPAGDWIREMQSLFEHGANAMLNSLTMSVQEVDPAPKHEQIRAAIARTDTAPIVVDDATSDGQHAVLGYHTETDGGTTDILCYDPNDTAENYRSRDAEAGVELDQADSHLDRAFQDPRHVITVDSSTGEIVESTYDLNSYTYFPMDRATLDPASDAEYPLQALVDTLQLPGKDADADVEDVAEDAMSAMVVRVDSAGSLSVTDPDGRELPTAGTDAAPDAVDYEAIAWGFGSGTGSYTIEVEGVEETEYTLDLKGTDPAGGSVATRIRNQVSEGETHVIAASLPQSGEGDATVVEGPSAGTPGANEASGSGSSSDATTDGATPAATGQEEGWRTRELAVLGGLLTIALYGYASQSED